MRGRAVLLALGVTVSVLLVSSMPHAQQAQDASCQPRPAAPPDPAPGRGASPIPGRGRAVPLSQRRWETWNNVGLGRGTVVDTADGPAPQRDLTGIWDTAGRGVLGLGTPEGGGEVAPLTDWGCRVGNTHRSGNGIRQTEAEQINDPHTMLGDPNGYPRLLLFELRQLQFVQTPQSVLALFTQDQRWRVIWTDGRQLPNDPDPRWFGYSIGRWIDDYTFVVASNGTDERTWLDNAGNPHSDKLRVEERWHRLSEKRLEMTITIDDPVAYTRPWVAVDKLLFIQLPPNTDLMPWINAASEAQAVAAGFKGDKK